jgi:hypothetical protein
LERELGRDSADHPPLALDALPKTSFRF